MSRPNGLSVIINTRNHEPWIRQAIENVAWADEILVVDMASTDRTVAIAMEYDVRVISVSVMDRFVLARNDGLAAARFEWTFVLDIDELITPELRRSIVEAVRRNDPAKAGYFVRRRNRVFSRWQKAGLGYPDPQLRLARAGAITYTRYFHHVPELRGEAGLLDGDLLHFHVDRASDFLTRIERYVQLDAEESHRDGVRTNPFELIARPIGLFLFGVIWLRGFLDGWRGVAYAGLHARHKFVQLRALLREQRPRRV